MDVQAPAQRFGGRSGKTHQVGALVWITYPSALPGRLSDAQHVDTIVRQRRLLPSASNAR